MPSKKKDIGKLLNKYGYSIPQTSDEIKAFEEKFEKEYESPAKWPEIKDIVSDKPNKVIDLKKESPVDVSGNLAMAARDGKKITKEVREKMNKDRNAAENE